MYPILYQITQLPLAIQRQVTDFLEFLLAKYHQQQSQLPEERKYPLRGSVLSYEEPFSGAANDDWEALP